MNRPRSAPAELRALMAWVKKHDITRSRAIRSLIRIGLATGALPDEEADKRTMRAGKAKREKT